MAGLLKAATLYGDEVILHHPTATMLASIASLGALGHADFVRAMAELAPHLGAAGGDFASALAKLDVDHGAGSAELILGALLDPESPVTDLISAFDSAAGRSMAEHQQEFAAMRSQLAPIVHEISDEGELRVIGKARVGRRAFRGTWGPLRRHGSNSRSPIGRGGARSAKPVGAGAGRREEAGLR